MFPLVWKRQLGLALIYLLDHSLCQVHRVAVPNTQSAKVCSQSNSPAKLLGRAMLVEGPVVWNNLPFICAYFLGQFLTHFIIMGEMLFLAALVRINPWSSCLAEGLYESLNDRINGLMNTNYVLSIINCCKAGSIL